MWDFQVGSKSGRGSGLLMIVVIGLVIIAALPGSTIACRMKKYLSFERLQICNVHVIKLTDHSSHTYLIRCPSKFRKDRLIIFARPSDRLQAGFYTVAMRLKTATREFMNLTVRVSNQWLGKSASSLNDDPTLLAARRHLR